MPSMGTAFDLTCAGEAAWADPGGNAAVPNVAAMVVVAVMAVVTVMAAVVTVALMWQGLKKRTSQRWAQ
jgi:hypothetical protein